MSVKLCPQCGKAPELPRKKYCSDRCKWLYNVIRREKEAYLPPVKKRNKSYFYMVVGSEMACSSRQGKRSGHMVTGSMSAMVMCTVEHVVPVSHENIERHFKGIPGYLPIKARTGDGDFLTKQQLLDLADEQETHPRRQA